ncbi:zinc finger protein 568 isoform X1 [Helicoverpa armigera]|uniref:zinc finger protein 568 isoform X1 n=1 Tax=Helicoverpa armigera TaxID=29058 RepID=UPI000B39EB30|nr:zinc finger protein 568 isoform X1 [Helicoverpa armigera]
MEEPQQKKLYYCSYEGCASYFDRPYRLAQHFLAHNNIRPFPCKAPNCNKAYTSKSHLDRHISSVHLPHENDVVYSCPQCLKSFANRQNLKRHMNTVHLVEFICDICKLAFKKKNQLSAHMYEHTGLKAFKCDLCSDTFISLYLKKRHMRYHKTYTCEECNVVFNHWSKYQKHKKTEHVSSYSSTPRHLKSFKSLIESNVTVIQPRFSLWAPGGAELRLMQSPSAEDDAEVFICNVCKKTFKEKGHMVKHLKTHGQKRITKTFPCPYDDCSRFYSRKSNLKQHILVKHMKILHECMICHAQLSTKAKLNYHVQLHYREGGTPIAKPKTEKNKERKPRKDEGSFKFSTALKLSGLNDVPEESDSAAESTESPINLSVKSEHIEVEVDVLI